MPTLNECMDSIRKLVELKGHEDNIKDVSQKLLFAVIEIAEAADIIKKHGISLLNVQTIEEELIDAIFYVLDTYGLIHRAFETSVNPDLMFKYKLRKNLKRDYRYGRPK